MVKSTICDSAAMGVSAVLLSAILVAASGHLSCGHHVQEIASLTFSQVESVGLDLAATRSTADARYDPDTQNQYHLFTRANPTVSQPLVRGNAGVLAASNYDNQRRTVVLLHGWEDSATADFNAVLVPALVTAADLNIIVVDWGAGATGDINNTLLSGESVARFTNWLLSASGSTVNQLFIIGFSMSGHQAGIVARNINGTVPHIIALDPANVFHDSPNRLRTTDALYVESIHTNGGAIGTLEPLGHVSFYPNGGINMPGCTYDGCDHLRCYYYLAESLVSGGFTGRRCDTLSDAQNGSCDSADTLPMGGLYAKFGFTGMYYLETNAGPPFSKG